MEGRKIKCKPTLLKNLNKIIQMEKDVTTIDFIIPYSLKQHAYSIQDKNQLHISVYNEVAVLIGFVLLSGIEDKNNAIELRRIIVSEKGKGYGTKILEVIIEMSFVIYKCNRLWLDVFSSNKRALYMYTKHGFKEEGRLRECVKVKEGYKSLVIMSILKNEYLNV